MRRRKQHNDFGLKGKQDEGREQDAPGPRSFWGKGYGFWVIGFGEPYNLKPRTYNPLLFLPADDLLVF